jgi:hypothetical protein
MEPGSPLTRSQGPTTGPHPETDEPKPPSPFYLLNIMFVTIPSTDRLCGLVVKTERSMMYKIVVVILIYHLHKPIDSINLLGS